MITFTIKTNNNSIIEYLLDRIKGISLDNTHYLSKKFKIYTNIIIHYKGENIDRFKIEFANIICDTVLEFYKERIIKKIINYNYFYFDEYEKDLIMYNCYSVINSSEYEQYEKERMHIFEPIFNYLLENKAMILDGFVNFRLKEYMDYMDNIVDIAVNKYIIEKEYKEFISLLRIYVNSKSPRTDLIYLIYLDSESTILDENKNIISIKNNMQNLKYLSDISFSSNDLALNTLLTLLPEKIEIFLLGDEDEFISTLKLIFEDRIKVSSNKTPVI